MTGGSPRRGLRGLRRKLLRATNSPPDATVSNVLGAMFGPAAPTAHKDTGTNTRMSSNLDVLRRSQGKTPPCDSV